MQRECPHCKALYEVDSKDLGGKFVCEACGKPFVAERSWTCVCPDCGERISTRAFSCPHCGRCSVGIYMKALVLLSFWGLAALIIILGIVGLANLDNAF